MKHAHRWWLTALLVPITILLAAAGTQDPTERRQALRFSELQFVDGTGALRVVPANQLLELRVHRMDQGVIQVELYYENKDYTLMNVTGFELIRRGPNSSEVNLVTEAPLIFPDVP